MLNKLKIAVHSWLKKIYFDEVSWGTNGTLNVFRGTFKKVPDKDDAWFYALSRAYRNIYDIGANIGFTAMLAALSGKKENIVLVDPNPEALAIASYNLTGNGFANLCSYINYFVSDQAGEQIKFYTVGPGAAGSMYAEHAKTASDSNSFIMVETVTLDGILERTGILPDLIKIDVEGAENSVLRGMSKILDQTSPDIFLELHSHAALSMADNARGILAWCRETGYRAWYLKDKVVLDNENPIAHRGRCHLLLRPVGREFPEELRHIGQGDKITI